MLQFLFGWWVLSNQDETNEKLQCANDLQQQNNQLLEQIRRLQLTPEQRAAEDKQREQLAARREAEAQLAQEREHTAYYLIFCFLTAVIGLCGISLGLQAHPIHPIVQASQAYPGAVPDIQVEPAVQPKPTPVSDDEIRAENDKLLKRLRQEIAAERPAVSAVSATPSPHKVPRAELVRNP
jgi:hypothetical protein